MSVHEYPWPIWNHLSEPETRRFQDIEYFKIELQKLIKRGRDQCPRGGELLILENRIKIYGPRIDIPERIELGDSLKSASFDDMGNMDWELQMKDSQIYWWRVKLAFDVVCIPAYTDEEIFNEYFYGYYRVFTRPTYLEINNKNK